MARIGVLCGDCLSIKIMLDKARCGTYPTGDITVQFLNRFPS